VALPDRRTIATVEFVADTFSEMLSHVERLCANPAVKFAITPTVDNHWPLSLERRRIVVGYGEILKFTPSVKNMINEKLLWHDGSTNLLNTSHALWQSDHKTALRYLANARLAL
jgi:hypothetical protein